MTRLPDWKLRLDRFLKAEARRPFAYGQADCALFAAGAVAAMTGTDHAAAFRGRYDTLSGGLALLRAAGFDDHEALAAHHLPAVHPGRAGIGDIAVFEGRHAPVLGVVIGAVVRVRAEGAGLASYSRDTVIRAYRP